MIVSGTLVIKFSASSLACGSRSAVCMGASVRTHAWQCAVSQRVPALISAAIMELLSMFSKRKANSPCESEKFKTTKVSSPDSNNSSIAFVTPDASPIKMPTPVQKMETENTATITRSVSYNIETRNGEVFRGAVDRPLAKRIWEKGINLPGELIYGIALNQSTDRPFVIDFELHEDIDYDECPDKYNVKLGGIEYAGSKFVPKPMPPELGEIVVITFKKTRFKITPEQATTWISKFGTVLEKADFVNASDLSTVKCDDIEIKAKLRKHVPGLLPAYGRKAMVMYPGQPIICGRCFELGHVRKACQNENVEWKSYVKLFAEESFVTEEMLGDWMRLVKL